MSALNTPATFQSVLVLEDNFLIALEAEYILTSLGVETVHIASTIDEAMVIVDQHGLDFALLDVQLGNDNSFAFAALLKERGIPFGFCSGYGDGVSAPAALGNVPKISKPFDQQSFANALESIRDGA
ncbi:response regulator [Pararhizobium sp.]|uniref:response regulator n=1 Tax=Pararhizobium sp. TaxID=1977563 RepID=UPI002719D34A|nr:response regulator [Pararhizobium sp.]MDO9415040.1 response regulator [Pararhizobium sp.]